MKQENTNNRLSLLTLGFLGVQMCVVMFGFAVPDFFNAYKDYFSITYMWLSVSVIGMFVQPLAGLASDHSWGPYGRRKYYILMAGAFASIAMFLMALSKSWILILFFFYLSLITLNIMLVIYRAAIVDISTNRKERLKGFILLTTYQMAAMVIVLILRGWSEINLSLNETDYNLPISVIVLSFIGAVILLTTTLISCYKIKEKTPDEIASSHYSKPFKVHTEKELIEAGKISYQRQGFMWLSITIVMLLVFVSLDFKNEVYIIPVMSGLFGIMLIIAHYINIRNKRVGRFMELMTDIMNIPKTMKDVSLIQAIGWFGIFMILTFLAPILTRFMQQEYAGLPQGFSNPYIFYIILSFIGLLLMPLAYYIAKHNDSRTLIGATLFLGGFSVWLFFLAPNIVTFIIFVLLFAFVWVIMGTIPFVMISNVIPTNRVGVFLGLFNTFTFTPYVLVPQVGRSILTTTSDGIIYIISVGALMMIIAGFISILGKSKVVNSQ